MTLTILVYLAGVFGKLSVLLGFALGLIAATLLFCGIVIDDSSDCRVYVKRLIIAAIVSASILALTPSERTMYVMAGAYAVQAVAENPDVQRVSGKVIKIIDQKLDDVLEGGLKADK